jgi:hypothetical protein
MQKAKRMVLVDERLLDSNSMMQHFQNKQDHSWKQPTEDSVKTSISKKLKATLDNPDVPDDVKAKRYSHDLNRFLQTKSKVPALMIEDLLDLKEEPTVDELLDLKEPVQKEETPSHKKSRKKVKEAREFANQEETAALRRHRLAAVGNDESDVLRGE